MFECFFCKEMNDPVDTTIDIHTAKLENLDGISCIHVTIDQYITLPHFTRGYRDLFIWDLFFPEDLFIH
jgi:hypothetical protein